MCDDDVGQMGEAEFEKWCAQVKLIANKAEVDRGAWDYLVQFPLPAPRDDVASLDHMPSAVTCWIQVKSRHSAESTPDIKLSNWVRMIDPAWPCFVLLLTFNGGLSPTAAHLLPVDAELATRALKRLRGLSPQDAAHLNRLTMTVSCREEHALSPPDGHSLKSAIEAHVGSDPANYRQRKQRWIEEAGYSGSRYRFSLRLAAKSQDDLEERLVEFALGNTSELPSTLTSFEEVRFGIPTPVATVLLPAEVRVAVPNIPTLPAKLEFRDASGSLRISLAGNFYNPRNMFPFLSDQALKFRFEAPFVDLYFGREGASIGVTLRPPRLDERRPLSDLLPACHFFMWCRDRSAVDLDMLLQVNDTRLRGRLRSPQFEESASPERDLARAALDAGALLHELRVDTSSVLVTPRELIHYRAHIRDAATIIGADRADIRLNGEFDRATLPLPSQIGYPMVTGAPIGRTMVMVGIAYYGNAKYTEAVDGKARCQVDSPRRDVVIVDLIPAEDGVAYSAAPYVERVAEWMEAKGIAVLAPTTAEPGHTAGLPDPI